MSTTIWFNKQNPIKDLEQFRSTLGGLAEALKLSIYKLDSSCLQLTMPVESIHKQPIGIVHGGTYCALAESVASIAANLTLDYKKQYAVGQQLNIHYFRPSTDGELIASATPNHLGKKSQVWSIQISHKPSLKLLSQATLTVAILSRS